MTAILGLHYLDGILMMADTEESLGGDAKSECDKLFRFICPSGTVITGGAGSSHLIDCANQDMHQFFLAKEKIKPQEILGTLNSFAEDFFNRVVAPLAVIPDAGSRFHMIIAVNCENACGLFRWEDNRVLAIGAPNHVSIGSGTRQTHPMLRDVQFAASKECMLFHGLRIMYHTKRTVGGVGGRTEAIALQCDGTSHFFGTLATQKIEELIANYEKYQLAFLDGAIFTIAVTDPHIEEELERNVERSLAGLPEVLRGYREEYRKILKPQITSLRKGKNKR